MWKEFILGDIYRKIYLAILEYWKRKLVISLCKQISFGQGPVVTVKNKSVRKCTCANGLTFYREEVKNKHIQNEITIMRLLIMSNKGISLLKSKYFTKLRTILQFVGKLFPYIGILKMSKRVCTLLTSLCGERVRGENIFPEQSYQEKLYKILNYIRMISCFLMYQSPKFLLSLFYF